jgi:hypothetical protein
MTLRAVGELHTAVHHHPIESLLEPHTDADPDPSRGESSCRRMRPTHCRATPGALTQEIVAAPSAARGSIAPPSQLSRGALEVVRGAPRSPRGYLTCADESSLYTITVTRRLCARAPGVSPLSDGRLSA